MSESIPLRKRHTRTATGCRNCRQQRVKCPEGPATLDGHRAACNRCAEFNQVCYYPVDGRTRRKIGSNDESRWAPAAGGSTGVSAKLNIPSGDEARSDAESACPLVILRPRADFCPVSLASFWEDPIGRNVVRYFEAEGCQEIVAAPRKNDNWIHHELFPRIFAALATSARPQSSIHGSIRDWLRASLLQLSYVHRGNVSEDTITAATMRINAANARQTAELALLRAQVRFPDQDWRTEEYLSGFFVRCMADMLSGGTVVIDGSNAFVPSSAARSPFAQSLADLVALYSTVQFACSKIGGFGPVFPLSPQGPDWVERFVGYSRDIIIKLGEVTQLVGDKVQSRGIDYDIRALELLDELGRQRTWEDESPEYGKSVRIMRGSAVMRSALTTLLLAEVLEVPLTDDRFTAVRAGAIEHVADAPADASGGLQWPLTIIATYTVDPATRRQLQELIRDLLLTSFGAQYPGTHELLALCWEVYDEKGSYMNGIAPWRETMSVFGRSIFL